MDTPSATKRLIVNADDFGRSIDVNKGVIEAHQKGIVTSASLMTTREGFDDAVELARKNPKLGIGLHLDLDDYFKVEHGVGRLLEYKDYDLPLVTVAEATEAQIRKLVRTGLKIGHLDGHHHVHLRPELFATVGALASKYRIPMIRHFKGFYEGLYPGVDMNWILELMARFNLKALETFFAGWEQVQSSLPGYTYFDATAPFTIAELMVHPGKGEMWRERELSFCTSPKTRSLLQQNHIELLNFMQLM